MVGNRRQNFHPCVAGSRPNLGAKRLCDFALYAVSHDVLKPALDKIAWAPKAVLAVVAWNSARGCLPGFSGWSFVLPWVGCFQHLDFLGYLCTTLWMLRRCACVQVMVMAKSHLKKKKNLQTSGVRTSATQSVFLKVLLPSQVLGTCVKVCKEARMTLALV